MIKATRVWLDVTWIGYELLPGVNVNEGIVALPMNSPSTDMLKETSPRAKVIGLGLGIVTLPMAFAPSGRLSVSRWNVVTSRPASPLNPGAVSHGSFVTNGSTHLALRFLGRSQHLFGVILQASTRRCLSDRPCIGHFPTSPWCIW